MRRPTLYIIILVAFAISTQLRAQLLRDTAVIVGLGTLEHAMAMNYDTSAGVATLRINSYRGDFTNHYFSPAHYSLRRNGNSRLTYPNDDRLTGASSGKGALTGDVCMSGAAIDASISATKLYFNIDCYDAEGERLARTRVAIPTPGHSYTQCLSPTGTIEGPERMTATRYYTALRHRQTYENRRQDPLTTHIFVTDHRANLLDTIDLNHVGSGNRPYIPTDLDVYDQLPSVAVVGYDTWSHKEIQNGDSICISLYSKKSGKMEREWFIHNTTLFGNRDDIYNPKIGLVDADNFVVAYPERDSITRFLYGGFGVIRIIGMNRHQAGPTWEYYPKYADFRTYRFGGMRYDPVADHMLLYGIATYPVGEAQGYAASFLYLLALDPYTGEKKWERLIDPRRGRDGYGYEGEVLGVVEGAAFINDISLNDPTAIWLAADLRMDQPGEFDYARSLLMRLGRDGCYRGDCGLADGVIRLTDLHDVEYVGRDTRRPTFRHAPNPVTSGGTLRLEWLDEQGVSPPQITVYDALGRTLLVTPTDGAHRVFLPLALPAGAYVLQWGTSSARVIVQ